VLSLPVHYAENADSGTMQQPYQESINSEDKIRVSINIQGREWTNPEGNWVFLELKILAHVCFIGFPNSAKSKGLD
jgi:translation initiation factor IF-3